ncbi:MULTISPECIES: glycosyltransferase family 4 protein [unclassified Pseudoalteromonas]|uniref:glycosyltransferase family 4 protein n=1 Tax=unclassified Pseudoalteromonas TaxID=194690 RepID=UPI0013FDBB1F|nr:MULTISPECIES: glycosyltransferase family 4 protein [unclassified Pseudoalteromonas]MBH0052314.1 glycosyltransferase family 4 protein [Pseudoalteromonas sp. SWYJZ19]
MNNIRLAFLGGRGLHSNYGGVENAIREISDVISQKENTQVTVYGTKTEGFDNVNQETKKNIQTVNCPSCIYKKLGQHGIIFWCVLHLIFVSRPNVVYVFASGPCIFTPLLRLSGIKVVSSLRAIDSARDKWGVVSRNILRMGEYCAWRFANVFTANSKEMIEIYSKNRADALFVPNGAKSINVDAANTLSKYNLIPNEYMLFAARIDPVKRLHLLINAHNNLSQNHRMKLVIAGGNSKDPQYLNNLMSDANDNILFVGHLGQQELEALLKNCRAFISPSILEGMSNSILSAMINGKAVLAADIKANTDIIDDDRAVFPADNLDLLQSGLMKISNDKDFCLNLGVNLKEHAQSNFSWESTANKFYDAAMACINPKDAS